MLQVMEMVNYKKNHKQQQSTSKLHNYGSVYKKPSCR